jgi:hypothetical protein
MASKRAQVQWGTSSGKSDSEEEEKTYKVDTTWMMPLEIKTAAKCKFLLKAGNRNYTLDGTSKNGGTSEMSLRRKYE